MLIWQDLGEILCELDLQLPSLLTSSRVDEKNFQLAMCEYISSLGPVLKSMLQLL